MEINYDLWLGEGIESVIQIIAEFRLQVLREHRKINTMLSDEINSLTHYFDDEAIIIIANDGGRIVGYLSAVNFSESHANCFEFSNYGSDLKISQGPIVHPMYRKMGIATELIRELINECQIRDLELLCIDPIDDQEIESGSLNQHILSRFNFESIQETNEVFYKKQLVEII